MKLKRLVASMLALLLAVSLLPMAAMAEETVNSDNDVKLEQDYDKNTGDNVTVDSGVTVGTNTGKDVTNNGTITNNGTENGGVNSGTVDTNKGTIENNYGTITDNGTEGGVTGSGKVDTNNNMIENNYGTVVTNAEGATIVDNYSVIETNNGKVVENNYNPNFNGIAKNYGTVSTNYGWIYNNGGGTVEVNEVSGEIELCGKWSENPEDLTVKTNYGTAQYRVSVPNTDRPAYGVHCLDEKGEKVYLGQYLNGSEVEIDKLKREGYKLVGCEAVEIYQRRDVTADNKPNFTDMTSSEDVTRNDDGTVKSFKITRPTRLTMLWEKIVSAIKPAAPAAPSGGGEAVPTSYDPKYVGLGSVVTIGGSRYKVVEIKDDAFVVVSFDALPDEDVKDLNALFAKLFTAEQQKLIKNIGQLLDSEDVLTIFSKPGNHPVFEISKDLLK